jgi:cytochrome P450
VSEPIMVSMAELDGDPHGLFRRVRPMAPILRRDDGVYVAIGVADVESLATDPRTRQMETELMQVRGITAGALFDFYQTSMLFSNGPTHRKRRAPLSRAFAFRVVSELRPRIRAIADELIDAAWARGEMKFLDDYAAAIPARVISSILGLPPADIPRFTGWVYQMALGLSGSFTQAQLPDIDSAARDLIAYVRELLSGRRNATGNEILASYAMNREDEGQMSPLEVRRTDHRLRHPVYGGGSHRCLGEALVRAESEGTCSACGTAPGTSIRGRSTGHSRTRRHSPR